MNMFVIPENIPHELQTLEQWVFWGVDKDNLKCPYTPSTLKKASAGVPSTWGTLAEALERVKEGRALGVGFEFNGNGIVGIDLDTVRNPETGEISPKAEEIISQLDSYTEISPSEYGFHIFVVASDITLEANRKKLPGKTIVERYEINAKGEKILKKQEIEMYNQGHYFTVTGNVYRP